MISDKLLALRKRSGMSQQEAASAIGVTRQTVSRWGTEGVKTVQNA